MKLFKKITDKTEQGRERTRGMLASLFNAILKSQRKLADWLGMQSEKLSPRGKKISLLLFGVLMGGISLMLIINSFSDTSANASVPPQAIEAPAAFPGLRFDPILTPEEYAKLVHFKRIMDSLKQSREGRVLYDEILEGSTGLLDSIDFLLSIY